MKHRLTQSALITCLLMLAACAGEQTTLTEANYRDLTQWEQDDHRQSLRLFVDSCVAVAERPAPYHADNGEEIGDPDAWRTACDKAADLQANPHLTDQQAQQFFETNFMPYHVASAQSEQGHITGYYEPQLAGSLTRTEQYQTPVYGVPNDLPAKESYFTRAEIEQGAMGEHAPVLLYVQDPVALFFLHVQGSGKVQLPDGSLLGLQYAAQNHQNYVAIGKILRDEEGLDPVSMQTIRDWLHQHPDRATEIMQRNPAYVFFQLTPGDDYPKGALQLPLTPGRSIAIDHQQAAYGLPVYLSTTISNFKTQQPEPLNRLFIAQDTGGALHGPHRIDIFFGRGEEAEWQAGQQDTLGNVYWLLPKPKAPAPEVSPPEKLADPDLAQAVIPILR